MSPRVPRPEASDTIVALTAATPFGITAVARIASGMTNRCNPPPTLPIHSHTRRRPRVPCTLSVAELNPRSKSGVSAPLPPRKCGVYAPLVPRTRPFASPRVDVVGGARHACAHVTVSATPPRNSTSFSGGDELPGGNKRSSIVVARSSGLRATTSDGGSPASGIGARHRHWRPKVEVGQPAGPIGHPARDAYAWPIDQSNLCQRVRSRLRCLRMRRVGWVGRGDSSSTLTHAHEALSGQVEYSDRDLADHARLKREGGQSEPHLLM
eukprot:scaffold20628_cov31-Tisochrysis_lutea.AAC.7